MGSTLCQVVAATHGTAACAVTEFPQDVITINKHGKEEEPSELRSPWS
jgi:hypothetical protein